MQVLYLWKKSFHALSDIDIYFDKIFHRNENEINIQNILNFLKINKIEMILIQNPYQNEKRLSIYNYLLENKYKVIVSDRGALPNSWFFDSLGFNAQSDSYNCKYWDHPLSQKKEKRVINYMQNEINNEISLEKQGARLGKTILREKLNIPQNKKILFVPLQRPSDTVIKYFSKHVKSINHFLKQIIDVQEKLQDDWVVIVKKHPLETEKFYTNSLFYVEDDTHFKDLIELCDAVTLINSGVGLISMIYKKPVYYFGDIFYSHPLINQEVKTSDELTIFLKRGSFNVNTQKVKRLISYLIEDFYSFGKFTTTEKIMDDNSKFYKLILPL